MKKYLLGISITVGVILAALLIVVVIMFYNMKDKAVEILEQVKSGDYAELVKQNTENLIPESLKNLQAITVEGDQCEYFYQKVDSAIEYLNDNPDITGSEIYSNQLSTLKSTIEKTPSTFKNAACEKGISSLNYIINTVSPSE